MKRRHHSPEQIIHLATDAECKILVTEKAFLDTILKVNDECKLIEHVVTSRAYQTRNVVHKDEKTTEEYVHRGPVVKRMTAEQFLDALWMITRAGPTARRTTW